MYVCIYIYIMYIDTYTYSVIHLRTSQEQFMFDRSTGRWVYTPTDGWAVHTACMYVYVYANMYIYIYILYIYTIICTGYVHIHT